MNKSKKQRIEELETQVQDLKSTLSAFMEFVGYECKEYVSVFEKVKIEKVNINIYK